MERIANEKCPAVFSAVLELQILRCRGPQTHKLFKRGVFSLLLFTE